MPHAILLAGGLEEVQITVVVMGNYHPPSAEALADEIVEFLAAQN